MGDLTGVGSEGVLAMDMGQGGHTMADGMVFHWTVSTTIWFPWLSSDTLTGYITLLVLLFGLGVARQCLLVHLTDMRLQQRTTREWNAVLYWTHSFSGYALMLATMNFNLGVLLAVTLGFTFGWYRFPTKPEEAGRRKAPNQHVDSNSACASQTTSPRTTPSSAEIHGVGNLYQENDMHCDTNVKYYQRDHHDKKVEAHVHLHRGGGDDYREDVDELSLMQAQKEHQFGQREIELGKGYHM